MSAFDKYIDDLVNNRETIDDFPKNESSWGELFDFGKRRIGDIVTLRRELAALRAERDALKYELKNAETSLGVCKTLSIQIEGANSSDKKLLFELEGIIHNYFRDKAALESKP